MNQELRLPQSKFAYINKWTSNDQINHKLSNQFWRDLKTTNAWIAQTSNCTLCPNNTIDTWPHLLSTCSNPHIKGLCIARHNKAIHQIIHKLQSIKHTRYYTLINAGNQNSRPQDNTIPQWLLQCTCPTIPCTCLAKLRPNILCILGAPIIANPPPPPNANPIKNHTLHWSHLLPWQFPNTTHNEKAAKYNRLIHALRTTGWQVNPLIITTTGVRGAIHEQPIKDLEKLKIPKNKIKTLMKHLQQIAIKHLTYLILNKRKQDNKQPPYTP